MIRVLIGDDHAVVRRGLRDIINESPGMQVSAEAADGPAVLQAVRHQPFDVAVLDMAMPGLTGLELLDQLRHSVPALPVLILSMYPEEQFALRALKRGAAGYLTKESAADELVTAIRRAAAGGRYVSQSLAQTLVASLGVDPDRPLHASLSDREFQVLRAIGAGKSVSDIATELNLSVKTISTYRRRILAKLDLNTTAELIRYALEHDLAG